MLKENTINELVNLGGTRWQKEDKDRIYLNKASYGIIGLELDFYNTGNLSKATLDGETISNSSGNRVRHLLGKTYVDVNTGKVHGTWGARDDYDLIDKIQNYVDELNQ